MDILLPIIKVVFGFGIIMTVHELGHALAAILCGIEIKKFSIGIGPGFRIKNVPKLNEVVISPFIFIGYAKINAEDLAKKSFLKKFIVYISGILANILLTIVLLRISGYDLSSAIRGSITAMIDTLSMIKDRISDGSFSMDIFTGPIGIVKMLATTTDSYLFLLASMSLGFVMFNLLPLHPLDGGRILISLLEKIFGPQKMKKPSITFMWISIIIIIILLIFIISNDIIKLFENSQIK